VLDKGDEAVGSIESVARENGIAPAQLTGIGACSGAVLGSSIGRRRTTGKFRSPSRSRSSPSSRDIALGADGKPALHLHVVVSRATASQWAAICWTRMSGQHWKWC
jgi:uncharacterized protein